MHNNNNNSNNNNNNNNNSEIIYTGTNDEEDVQNRIFKVCCPFIHSNYNKNNGSNDKFFKYNTLQ